MGLYVQIPDDKKKLEQAIFALEWQIKHEEDEKSKEIHRKTLKIFKASIHDTGCK